MTQIEKINCAEEDLLLTQKELKQIVAGEFADTRYVEKLKERIKRLTARIDELSTLEYDEEKSNKLKKM